jgi:hypothetical protein
MATKQTSQTFVTRASQAQIKATARSIVFPERIILLAENSLLQLTQIERLFELLAELRFARIPNSEFLNLAPRDQADFFTELLGRTTAPTATAPSVCHLDTGIQAGHPLLENAIDAQHVLPHQTGAESMGTEQKWPASHYMVASTT